MSKLPNQKLKLLYLLKILLEKILGTLSEDLIQINEKALKLGAESVKLNV
jgi:hypothetical protein